MLILLISKLSSLPYFEDYQNVRRSAFQKSFVHDIAFPRVEISSSIERIWAGSSRKNPLRFCYYDQHPITRITHGNHP